MKKLLLMAFLAVGMTANAEEKNENVVLDDANTVASAVIDDDDVFTDDGGVKIGKGKDDDDRWSMHFAVGVNIPTGVPDGMKFSTFRSWEFNWTIMQYDYTPNNSKTTLSAGLGFNWRAYTLKGHNNVFFKDEDLNTHHRFVNFVPSSVLGPNADNISSNIHTTAITLPLLFKQRFSKSFAISLGAQLNWNYYACIHNNYEMGDDDVDAQLPESINVVKHEIQQREHHQQVPEHIRDQKPFAKRNDIIQRAVDHMAFLRWDQVFRNKIHGEIEDPPQQEF